jgi:plastocyanin
LAAGVTPVEEQKAGMHLVLSAFLISILGIGGTRAEVQGRVTLGGHGTSEVVVWLDAPNAPRPARPPRAVLDQRNMSFIPHVLAVRTGTIVEFPNHDRVFHNVFSFHDGKKFDLGLYPVGAVRDIRFDRSGLSRIYCNIHPHMAAYVVSVDTPYFAVTDSKGEFKIADLPEGVYTYHTWRAGHDTLTSVAAVGVDHPLSIALPADNGP